MKNSTSKYHVEECKNCSHRHVCKYIDTIDKLLKTGKLPLILEDSHCNEYLPDEIVELAWEELDKPVEKKTFAHKFVSNGFSYEDSMEQLLDSMEELDKPIINKVNRKEFLKILNDYILDSKASGQIVDTIIMSCSTLEDISLEPIIEIPTYITLPCGIYDLQLDRRISYGYFAVLYTEEE